MIAEPEQKSITEQSTPPSKVVIKRNWSFKAAIVIGGIALLFIGHLSGQVFERSRVRHFLGWRNNYEHNFFGSPSFHDDSHGMGPSSRFRAHSLLGKILAIEDNKLTVQDMHDQTEQSVVISDATVIRTDGSAAERNDLKIEQQIAVFGRPNNEGQIEARLIRIFPDNENPIP